jgi:hypothetical protein
VRIGSFANWQAVVWVAIYDEKAAGRRSPAAEGICGIYGRKSPMQSERETQYEKVVRVIIGLVFVAGILAMLNWIWPAGWTPL